ncbi:hypothetical protein CMO93_05905 [Candidatus Woesearchaeota archaeon]|nr:hypothetical protein [Candidatus Woesearchaeota archaeon]|tara:strand:+ start:6505 stop:6807 length:303 start_codon:yes stop_codon:yes gene_type:complete
MKSSLESIVRFGKNHPKTMGIVDATLAVAFPFYLGAMLGWMAGEWIASKKRVTEQSELLHKVHGLSIGFSLGIVFSVFMSYQAEKNAIYHNGRELKFHWM